MLSCLLNNQRINCIDGEHTRDQLKTWAKKRILLCPACGKPYEYCHGKVKSPYFRHMDKVECEDRYSEPETEEHLAGKKDLYEWLKKQPGVTDCELEGWIPGTKQRPDIMFKYNGQQCVLEYQCSPISTEYYERHELYQAAGIKDIWVCGVQKYFQYYHRGSGSKRVNTLEKECGTYYDSTNKCFYIIDKNLNERTLNQIVNNKTYAYVMRNPYDYRVKSQNYYLVKDKIKSYDSYSYYPSGRPTRKYPYPVTVYSFDKNVSLAKCVKLQFLRLKNIQ